MDEEAEGLGVREAVAGNKVEAGRQRWGKGVDAGLKGGLIDKTARSVRERNLHGGWSFKVEGLALGEGIGEEAESGGGGFREAEGGISRDAEDFSDEPVVGVYLKVGDGAGIRDVKGLGRLGKEKVDGGVRGAGSSEIDGDGRLKEGGLTGAGGLLRDFYPEVGAGVIPSHGKAGMALPIVVLLEEGAEGKARGVLKGPSEVPCERRAKSSALEVSPQPSKKERVIPHPVAQHVQEIGALIVGESAIKDAAVIEGVRHPDASAGAANDVVVCIDEPVSGG